MTATDTIRPAGVLAATARRFISAPPRTVFDAWLDPGLLARFMTPAPGTTVPHAAVQARVGGRFEITMKIGGTEIPHHDQEARNNHEAGWARSLDTLAEVVR